MVRLNSHNSSNLLRILFDGFQNDFDGDNINYIFLFESKSEKDICTL